MASPDTRDGLFNNADPFLGDAPTSNQDDSHVPPAPARGLTFADETTGDTPDEETKAAPHLKPVKSPSEASVDQGSVIEKIETATQDAGAAVVDKVKSAAHRFHLDAIKTSGVSDFFHPTTIRMKVRFRDALHSTDSRRSSEEMALLWRARDQRKGRNSIAVPLPEYDDTPLPMRYTPKVKAGLKDILGTFRDMITKFPYWDMAFWSGWSYTIGSLLFVVDGVLAWGPVAYEDTWALPESADTYGGPLCFFIGALFYQVGAVTAYLEAVNDGSFHGAAMRRLLDGHEDEEKAMLDEKLRHFFSPHHHRHEDGATPEAPAYRRGGVDMGGEETGSRTNPYLTWRWWPTWEALRTHHVYQIGFLACTIQLFGVTLYGITGIVVLPGILSSLVAWQKLGAFWVPQVVAALCFLIASVMFMLETQDKWWKLEPGVLGWWIGFWATTGSVGFELIAIFGIMSLSGRYEWAEYQSDLATIWGSGAYFMSSFLQWYEALNKNPVEELLREPGEMKSSQVHPI